VNKLGTSTVVTFRTSGVPSGLHPHGMPTALFLKSGQNFTVTMVQSPFAALTSFQIKGRFA
jgi:hypothetical protein